MKRRPNEFDKKTKAAAFWRADGKCMSCKIRLIGGAEYDHVIPVALGGSNEITNCEVLCKKCHRIKTNRDVASIAKAKRVEANHIGAKAKGKWPSKSFKESRARRDNTKQIHEVFE